jgi:hypothetical protein
MPRERQDSGGYHRGRGSHACPASIRPTHPVVTNRSSPHYAEALAGGCSAPTTPTPWPRSIGSRRTVVIARRSLGRTPVGGAGFRRQRISGGRACRKQQTGGQWNDIRRAHRAGRRRPVLLTWAGVELRSPSFGDYQPIPARHAKDHDNLSPALEWSGCRRRRPSRPCCARTRRPRGTFTHWVLAGLHPTATGLAEGEHPAAIVRRSHQDPDQDGTQGCGVLSDWPVRDVTSVGVE